MDMPSATKPVIFCSFFCKYEIPAIGWFLVGGYVNNCVLYTFGITTREVDWYGMMFTLAVLLTASGYRDVGIYAQDSKYNPDIKKPTPEQQEANLPASV